MTKSDPILQSDVMDELAFDPTVDATNITVTAKDGVVTLAGTVNSYAEKTAAEQAAKRVAGVHGIAEELKIEIPSLHQRNDADIARAAITAIDWSVNVPRNTVTVKVENGWLTLDGEVDWQYQKESAVRAVEHLNGIRGVSNLIVVKAAATPGDVTAKIRKAFERAAEVDANRVRVEMRDGIVTLRGTVHSWNEHDEAAHAAFSVAGVRAVENLTSVQ